MKSIIGCIVFGGIAFTAMLVSVLYPPGAGRLVVVLTAENNPASIYDVLENTDGWLVEKVSDRTFVVESNTTGFVTKLYGNGAFLVMNGAADYGCDAPLQDKNTRKKIESPYRSTARLN